MLAELVVPTEFIRLLPQSRGTAGDFDHRGRRSVRGMPCARRLPQFLVIRQIMKQVRERLGVHHAMFERHLYDLLRGLPKNLVDDPAGALAISANLLN